MTTILWVPKYLILIVSSKLVWLPDPDILQLDKMVSFDVVDRLASLKVNGRKQFRYSQRVAITTGCEMDLTSFPHDKQVGTILYTSYYWP